MSKPNILVKKKRNEHSDNTSNTSNTNNLVSKNYSKPMIPCSNKDKHQSFLSSGPFKYIDTNNDDEPLIRSSKRRNRQEDDIHNVNNKSENIN